MLTINHLLWPAPHAVTEARFDEVVHRENTDSDVHE